MSVKMIHESLYSFCKKGDCLEVFFVKILYLLKLKYKKYIFKIVNLQPVEYFLYSS